MRAAIAVFAAVLLCLGQYVRAEEVKQDARHALAEELLNEMHMKENIEKSLAMVKKMMPPMPKKAEAKEGEKGEQPEDVLEQITSEMNWDGVKQDYIDIYADMFTEEELKGLVDFYKSPAGKAFVEKQPDLMKRSMEVMQKRMMKWMPKLQGMSGGMGAPVKPKATPEAPAEK